MEIAADLLQSVLLFLSSHYIISSSIATLVGALAIFSAAHAIGLLRGEGWDAIQAELADRSKAMHLARDNAVSLGATNPIELAIIDVTVTKAQTRLSRRANFFLLVGSICWAASLGAALNSLDFLKTNDIPNFIKSITPLYGANQQVKMDGFLLTMWVIRGATLGAAYLAAIVIPGWLGIAFFHEATTLYNRRHAVRFGRLYLYLKCANAKDISAIDLGDLERALGWNIQTPSAFKDIDMSKLPKSGVSPDVLAQTIEALSKLKPEKNTTNEGSSQQGGAKS